MSAPQAPAPARKRILIAEDDPAIAEMLMHMLRRNHDVVHALNGGIQTGARHYIQKPFSIEDVLSKVKKTIGE